MSFRSLRRPLTDDQLRPMGPEETVLQFSQGLTEDEYRAVAGLLTDRPDVMLRAFGGYGFTLPDLEFLRFFPDLRRLAVDSLWGVLRSVDGLRHLPDDVVELRIGSLKPPFDVEHIRRFRRLRHLGPEGPLRHPGVISTFVDLETLLVRSVTLDGLESLVPLTSLRRLDLKLGGTRDLRLLPRIGRLEELEIWRVSGLSDLTAIRDVVTLRSLWLEALPQVKVLPDLSHLVHLRNVTIHTMKGLRDLAPLATAPGLEQLSLIAMPHIEAADLRPLAGHPTLRRAHWNIGSLRKSYEAHDVLPLPPAPYGYDDWQAGVPYREIRKRFTEAVTTVGLTERDGRMVRRDAVTLSGQAAVQEDGPAVG